VEIDGKLDTLEETTVSGAAARCDALETEVASRHLSSMYEI
jgi:hypothetical protein